METKNDEILEKEFKKWEKEKLEKFLGKNPEREKIFFSASGIEEKRIYTPLDRAGKNYLEELGFPGEYPFTRGVYPTMYRGRLWTMRQYAGFASAKETNKRFKYLIEQGQTGLSVAFDLPTQMGYDSDHPLARGEVGRVGVIIDTLKDMETLFEGIPLDRVSTSMTINAPTAVILAMYIAVAQKQGVDISKLAGTVQNDILKEYVARGTYIFPPKPSMRLVTDVIEYCTKNMPRWNPISISGYHIREAGANAVQEIAFTLANGICYVNAVLERGLDIDQFAGRLSFFFSSHNDFFEEIAKFRAARRLWAKIMRNRFKAKEENSLQLRFHTQTAGSTLTAQQPENNIIRVALQALAAVLGGTQSLHTNSMDEALALPTEESVRIALRTQQIIAYESGVTNTIDPLGGSYFIETLTDKLEEQALDYIREIDKMGGMVKAIEKGYVQKEIASMAYKYQKEVEKGEKIIVGVNKFQTDEKLQLSLHKLDPQIEKEAISNLKKVKEERNNKLVDSLLEKLREEAKQEKCNLMPTLIEAVKAYATLGEICQVLREVFGEFKPQTM
ncbi:MAG: methylmalonyl-CoA mutase family protein [Candidatus Freyarchaeota archaeon]|nr:methylmalonyl-CoA mutase family protein [Candidatus Jordarchaeia archaeon]MBS7270622.1 methylmalonyl-CoA mutase family protein [Candidatus Jordarchaeia archaeon]